MHESRPAALADHPRGRHAGLAPRLTADATDLVLVRASLAGSAAAFGKLVERHQSLVCAVTYGATGDAALSEDIAQDAFVTAWRELSALRDPARFRSWVCGIARNLARGAQRHRRRHAPAGTEPSERLTEIAAADPSPLDHALAREQRDLIARALRDIPARYREPLVLFYRHDESIAQVAAKLGLTEQAVKQRLRRGRVFLARGVEERIAGAARASKPGRNLAAAVVAVIAMSARQASWAAGSALAASPGASAWTSAAAAVSQALAPAALALAPAAALAVALAIALPSGAAPAQPAFARVDAADIGNPVNHVTARSQSPARDPSRTGDLARAPARALGPEIEPRRRIARSADSGRAGRPLVEMGEPEIARGAARDSRRAGLAALMTSPVAATPGTPAASSAPSGPADRPGPALTAREAVPAPHQRPELGPELGDELADELAAASGEPTAPNVLAGPGTGDAALSIAPPDFRQRVWDVAP